MSYDKLMKLYYKKGENYCLEELQRRMNSFGTYLTPLTIQGFKRGQKQDCKYSLFYVNIHELFILNNTVLINSSKISALIGELPDFVVEPYFEKLIINEAQSTNEIEGIRSTKKELKEALNDSSKSNKNKRFKGLIKSYLYIDKILPFNDITDFRRLYDDLVSEEIDKDNTPDGQLFRKKYVEVNDGNQTTHIGILSEEKIINALNELILFLDDDHHPELYRYMIAHYFYEYIHPFYDGNGRTGRLLVCSYLSRYLERFSAITFSYAINKNRSKYYKALEEIANPFNFGEVTFYLIDMLELLITGQGGIIDDLELNLDKLKSINKHFREEKWKEKPKESGILKAMVCLAIFVSEESSISILDLLDHETSRYKLNKMLVALQEEGYLIQVSQRPKSYKVTNEFLDSLSLT